MSNDIAIQRYLALLAAITITNVAPAAAQSIGPQRVGDWTVAKIAMSEGGNVCSALRSYGRGYALEIIQARGLPGQLIMRLESPQITYRPGQTGEEIGSPYGLTIVIGGIMGGEGPDAIVRRGPRGLGFVTMLKAGDDPKFSPIWNLRVGDSVYAYIGTADTEVKTIGHYSLAGSGAALDALGRCVNGEAAISPSAVAAAPAPTPIAVTSGNPTRTEIAAVTRALGKDRADELPVSVGRVDLNGDHRPDLIFWSKSRDYCGALGCDSGAVLATSTGYAARVVDLDYSWDTMFVLPTVHNGMHDIRYGTAREALVWDGRQYQ